MDTFAAFAESSALRSMTSQDYLANDPNTSLEFAMLRILQACTSFTIIFFTIEMLALFLAFRFSFLIHLGYLIDVAVLCTEYYLEYNGYGKRSRLLNIFRFWRFYRLFKSMVAIEIESHDVTKIEVNELTKKITKMNDTIKLMQDEISKEKVRFVQLSYDFYC
jgi:hypothetical protein